MRILSPLLIILSVWLVDGVSPSYHASVSVDLGDPDIKDQGKFLYYKLEPFSGTILAFFSRGKPRSSSHYEYGQLSGPSMTWFENGNLESMRLYRNGEKEGVHVGWWPNGNKRFWYSFSRGLYNGPFKEWYPDGKQLHEFEYSHGDEVSAIGWRENGKTYINFVVLHGKKYGLTNARLCYSLKDEQGIYSTTKD